MADSTRLPIPIRTIPYRSPKIEIDYPQAWGLSNPHVEQTINQTIIHQANMMIHEQFNHQVPGNTEMTGSYEIKNNQRGILSLSQYNYAYTAHAAHGLTLLKALTIQVQTGKVYTLRELFQPGSDYVNRLNTFIRAQIKERDVPLLEEFKGISPNQDYYIADKSLVIFFQLYEITPYVYGFPMFPISVYALQDIIIEDGPLGIMIPGV
ncbi:MAG: DUF3298 domain-containing protein [Paenibacillaceae bacterium]